ncbi:FaeA/PapI family transcriptional regulator [Erwinia sp. JUb26]|uniref:FaeA/PapI family transcriptional regulator n=1 Tax=Erwinia sp. JUb26 TaxID=2485126 RepID=UPI000F4705C6|nr:FaeA/PapI family transcriptional regulator [Erwinia sp. JUb26]ROR08821.1 FaeA-like protein [Erwinia sp. JUb26]
MIESTRYFQRATSVERVITALQEFYKESDTKVYASTRDIADRSELSIYNARHILIKLEKEGVITSVKQRKSLYWNKTESFTG